MATTPTIFLSYSWANKSIADEIDQHFQSLGIRITRDERDAKYRMSLKDYMHKVSKVDYVIMLISDGFLRSENCMYELLELLNTHELESKIIPVIVDNVKIFKPEDRKIYYDFWDTKTKKADKDLASYKNQDFALHLQHCKNVLNNISEFFVKVTDLVIYDFQRMKAEGYLPILEIIKYESPNIAAECIKIAEISDREEQDLAFEKLQDTYKRNERVSFLKGFIAYKNKEFKKARAYYEDHLKEFPLDEGGHNNYALLIADHFPSETDLARFHFEEAVRLKPEDYELNLNLGLYYKKTLDTGSARKFLEKAIAINPEGSQAYGELADILSEVFGELDEAEKCYVKSIELNNGNAFVVYNYANYLRVHKGEFEKAILFYKKAIALDGALYQAHGNYALILMNSGDLELAREELKKAIEINPNFLEAHVNLANVLMDLGDFESSESHCKQALEIEDSPYVNAVYGTLMADYVGDIEKAKYHYQKALSKAPDDPSINFNYALVLEQLNSIQEAKQHYKKAVRLNPALHDLNFELRIG